MDTLQSEDIHPYIYEVRYKEKIFYEKLYRSHPTIFGIYYDVYTGKEDGHWGASFEDTSLEKATHNDEVSNLNYEFNLKTYIYQLLIKLQGQVALLNNDFDFSR